MKILYGVVGEGMGHAMRSRVVLERLTSLGHEVEIMASGRAVDFLGKRFEDVNRIHGLHMIYEENRVRRGKTFWSNVLAGTTGVPRNILAYFELITSFHPEMVISDFESWTYFYAKAHRLPIVSIDNMQIINRCVHDESIYARHETDFQIAKAFVKGKLPYCDEYIITSFFRPEIRKPKTRIVAPILRPEILAATRSRGEHLLVYQTAEGNDGLAETLKRSKIPCRVYGMKRDLKEELVEDNLVFCPFSETQFIADLASSRGVIAGGGFTLMGETVFLRKPMLAVPLSAQFEQVMNARYLERLGYGKMADSLEDPSVVLDFVANLETYERALESYTQVGNEELFGAIDEVMDRAQAGLL